MLLITAGMARDHRKLDAFNLADELVIGIYRLTARLPSSERFGLQRQIRRAAVSIPTNIVEGCARESEADYLRFLDISLGSSREVLYLLSVAVRLEYIRQRDATATVSLGERVTGCLVNLRKSYGRR